MEQRFDIVLRGGEVIDGTGAPRVTADVGVRGERIAAVGRLEGARADVQIDASGKIVSPGFIDSHTHDDRLLLSAPEMAPKASQGVTTVIAGQCGISLAPFVLGSGGVPSPLDLIGDATWLRFPDFRSYVEELRSRPAALNAALLVGHTTLRIGAVSDWARPASAAEIRRMRAQAREAFEAGAIGFSTGIYYEPVRAATAEEVMEIFRGLGGQCALYCSHLRHEGEPVLESMEEAFRIGRELGARVIVSHHKVSGKAAHGRSRETLALFEERMSSQAIGLDCYPYHASSTILSADRAAGAERTLVTWSTPHPELAGKDLAETAASMGVTQEEAVARLLPAGAVYFTMDEADVRRILSFPRTMIGSDGLPHDAVPHPRLWGTFPRVLGHYARDLGLFPLETAVHKMTGLTASCYGLEDRGVLREGAFADLCVFDPLTVEDTATFADPVRPAKGIDAVIVNGRTVWRHGASTGERPGRVLGRGDSR